MRSRGWALVGLILCICAALLLSTINGCKNLERFDVKSRTVYVEPSPCIVEAIRACGSIQMLEESALSRSATDRNLDQLDAPVMRPLVDIPEPE